MATQAIQLTVTSIDGVDLPTPTIYGFDLFDIVEPIRTNTAKRGSIVVVRNVKGNSQSDKSIGKVTYDVSETVNTIISKNPDMIFGSSVTKRNFVEDPSLFPSKTAFLFSRVSGFLSSETTLPASNTSFYYNEDGDPYNVYYELLDKIITTLT